MSAALTFTQFGVEVSPECRQARAAAILESDRIMEVTSDQEAVAADKAIERLRLVLDALERARSDLAERLDKAAWRAKEPVADEIGRLAALKQRYRYGLYQTGERSLVADLEAQWEGLSNASSPLPPDPCARPPSPCASAP